MKTLNYTLEELLFSMLENNNSITILMFYDSISDIKHEYSKHNIEICFLSEKHIIMNFFNVYIPKRYKSYLHIKFNSGNPILIKKKDINFKYKKVYFTFSEYRKNKIVKLLSENE